jgi:hypothetical protein
MRRKNRDFVLKMSDFVVIDEKLFGDDFDGIWSVGFVVDGVKDNGVGTTTEHFGECEFLKNLGHHHRNTGTAKRGSHARWTISNCEGSIEWPKIEAEKSLILEGETSLSGKKMQRKDGYIRK